MDNLIKQLLREELEMKEMGLKINKLKELQPSNYLLQSLKQKESRRAKTIGEKSKYYADEVNRMYVELDEKLKSLSWSELNLSRHPNKHFYLKLPKDVIEYFKYISKYYELIDSEYYRLVNNVDKVYYLRQDYLRKIKPEDINMYIEEYRNRTHFPEGLPQSLLGYNLGYKMYRKLVDDLKFIQSEENATKEVQAIYRKLLEQTDLNVILNKHNILIMRRDLSKDEKLKIVSEFIYQFYLYVPRNRPGVLQKDIILDGPLFRELNPNKLEKLNNDIFEYSRFNGDRKPFSDSPLKTDFTYIKQN